MADTTFQFSNFLPVVNQTDTIVSFFNTTVDQLFQPGQSKSINGYVGEVPSYYDSTTDFYIGEPTVERSVYQLEPTMVSYTVSNTTNAQTINNSLTYPNFISYLLNSGAVTTNQSRMFENDYFSWAPPIDIDKISNYNQYYWLGNSVNSLPVLTINTPVAYYVATQGQTVFPLPAVTIENLPSNAAIYQNGQKIGLRAHANNFTLTTPANAGDIIITTPYNDLTAIQTQTSVQISGLVNCYSQYVGDGLTTNFSINNNSLSGNLTNIVVYLNGNIQIDTYTVVGNDIVFNSPPKGVTGISVADVVTIVTYNGLSAVNLPPEQMNLDSIAENVPTNLTSGMLINIYDTNQVINENNTNYTCFVDGVGQSIRLTNLSNMMPVVAGQYSTIDRSSIDQNSWSLHNWWVHNESFAWSNKTYGTVASRPIIEFIKDIVLYNYGNKRIYVDAIMSQQYAYHRSNGIVYLIPFSSINGLVFGQVSVDNTSITDNIGSITEKANAQDYAIGFDIIEQGNANDLVGIEGVVVGQVFETETATDYTTFSGLYGVVLEPGMTLFVNNGTSYNGLYTVSSSNGSILLTPITNISNGEYFTTPLLGIYGGADVVYNVSTNTWNVQNIYDGATQETNSISNYTTTLNGEFDTASYDYVNFSPLSGATFNLSINQEIVLVNNQVSGGTTVFSIGSSLLTNGNISNSIVEVTFSTGNDSPSGVGTGTVKCAGNLISGPTTWNVSGCPFKGCTFNTGLSGTLIAQSVSGTQVYGTVEINTPAGTCVWNNVPFGINGGQLASIQSMIVMQNSGTASYNASIMGYSGVVVNETVGTGGPGSGGNGTTPYQNWVESKAPLFYLFNPEPSGIPLDSSTVYPGSNFSGSNIFAYATGTGTEDSVLLQPLQYDANGYIVFENKTVTDTYTYANGDITGLYCYGTYIKLQVADVFEIGNAIDDAFAIDNDDFVNSTSLDRWCSENGNAIDYVNVVSSVTTVVYEQVQSLWKPSPYGTSQSVKGVNGSYPTIPVNLQANPLSEDISTLSLSDFYLHFSEIIGNQQDIIGNTYSANSYRDSLRDLSLGTEICQHIAPMLKSMLLSSAEEFDLPNAIRFAQQEYRKFKNKFATKLVSLSNRGVLSLGVADNTTEPNNPANWLVAPSVWVSTALNEIKANYNSSFPFSLSTMGGSNYFIPPTPAFLGILAPTIPMFVTDTTYNNKQLYIRGHDGSYLPAFGNLDNNGFSTDYRDYIILQLEINIYNSIPSVATNEANIGFFAQKRLQFDIDEWMNNVWYSVPNNNGYSLPEITQILKPIFEQWAQQGKFDYKTYDGYDPANPFTWNYNGVQDKFGNYVPGNWRAIYNWYFDTDHPHTRPWEMLGFADIPDWWTEMYGFSYGSANKQLWSDLETGTIQQGPRQGVDARYARPGLSAIIPVDVAGNLLNPMTTGIIPQAPIYTVATQDWQFGDWGPVEAVWRNSSSYKFALAELGFYIKPPRFVEINWDTVNYQYVGNQWLDIRTLNRPTSATDSVHGEINGGVSTVVIGIQQWIVDSLVNAGQAASVLGNAIRNIDVRLSHRMAGFVSIDGFKAVSDTFGLIPSEDVQVALYNAPAFDTETYSGVIIEWTGAGYRVVGYDNQNTYFTIFPPNTSGPKGILSLSTTPELVPLQWRPSTHYTVGVVVTTNNTAYQCTQSHTSASTFNLSYWTILGPQPPLAPRVTVYNINLTTAIQIPYGSVLNTIQDVANFLLGWQAYLVSRGWVFDQIDPNSGYTVDWTLALREFMGWAQVAWAAGNFIALSPGAEQLTFSSSYGTILNVEDPITGFFGLLDRSGNPITSRNAFISRTGGEISLQALNADIFGARLRLAEVEHILVFSNTTVFGDIIYVPLFNQKQPRLKLIANVSNNWNGRLSAPGYMVIGNDLVPNFEKNAEDIRTMFDIEKTDRSDFIAYARHNIGYQARSYMEDLLLSDTEQFEFFQGMIQAKGSPSVFERLLRSSRINENADVEFLEEWAIRQSTYGAPFNPRATVLLQQDSVLADPQFISFSSISNAQSTWLQIPLEDSRWLDTPSETFFPISTKGPKFPSAGPVRLSEVQYTSFNVDDLGTFYESSYNNGVYVFNTGERVWIYNNNFTWDVWRVFEISDIPNEITQIVVPSVDPTVIGMRIYFQHPLTITESDIGNTIIITASTLSTPDLIGVQTITNFDIAGQWIEVDQAGSAGYEFDGTVPQPSCRIFRSVRYSNTQALLNSVVYSVFEVNNLADNTTTFDYDNITYDTFQDANIEIGNASDTVDVSNLYNSYWIPGDIAYIDDESGTGLYSVRQWNGSDFVVIRNQPTRINSSSIITSTVYKNLSYIQNSTTSSGQASKQNAKLISNQPLIDDITIVDPIAGLIPGVAEREMEYITDVDPALYNTGSSSTNNPWGANQIGQVWWNLATCRFLDYYTDQIGQSNTRDIAEISYRIQNWAMVAPNTSVDVYEWVQSTVTPSNWATLVSGDTTGTYSGTVYSTTNYVQTIVFDSSTSTFVSYYYFWVKGKTSIPNVSFRKTDVATVASILTNPSATGTAWIAPILPNGILVSGVKSFLDNTGSALMVEVAATANKTHSEWVLLAQNDQLTALPSWLMRLVRDSLGGFTYDMKALPDPTLSTYRNTGSYYGQNIFNTTGNGLSNARKSYVGVINSIFAQTPIMQNLSSVEGISRSDTWIQESSFIQNHNGIIIASLSWTRQDKSYPIIPPPISQYVFVVYSIEERNMLLTNVLYKSSYEVNVLVDGRNTENPFWSIWTYNPSTAEKLINEHGENFSIDYLFQNASLVFTLATAYDVYTDTYADMIAGNFYNSSGVLVNTVLTPNTRVYVKSDETADGFWTVYNFLGNGLFEICYAQLYRTSDFYNVVDWYAKNVNVSGTTMSFSAANPPTVNYLNYSSITNIVVGYNPSNPTIAISNATIPNNQFVSIGDSSSFQWYVFDTTINTEATAIAGITIYNGWIQVAQSASSSGNTGTIALSDNFYNTGRYTYGLSSPTTATDIKNISNRDGSWEIKVIFDAINSLILSNIEINEVFFSLIHFVHTQQNEIDWIFKTSFMTIGSFSIPLTQTGILIEDPTTDLVNYVNEVKSYRVKIRDYSQQYSTNIDQANTGATDFDLPVYYDPTFKEYLPIIGTVSSNEGVTNFTLSQLPYQGVLGSQNFQNYQTNTTTTLTKYPWGTTSYPIAWVGGTSYNLGDTVVYNGINYECTVANTNSSFDLSNWTSLGSIFSVGWYTDFLNSANGVRKNTIKLLFDRVTGDGSGDGEFGYAIPPYSTQGYDSANEYGTIYAPWQANISYVVGDIVNYNGITNYQCVTSNNSSVFNQVDWLLLDSRLVNQTAAYRLKNYYDGTAINNVLSYSYGAADPMNLRPKGNELNGDEFSNGGQRTNIIDGGNTR